MATCRVDLEDSFKRALAQMQERAKDQVAVVIQSLEQKCKFEPDQSEYILQLDRYITACEHVEGWGWERILVPGRRCNRRERRTVNLDSAHREER
jgi:hypothetical protein